MRVLIHGAGHTLAALAEIANTPEPVFAGKNRVTKNCPHC
jgi:hypothetical protein